MKTVHMAMNLVIGGLPEPGLMTPSVTHLVEEVHAMSSRSIRRHAAGAIKAMREVVERGHLTI